MAGLINPRQIYAFGLNYVDHAKESNLPLPTEPFFFLKAASSLQRDGGVVEYPPSVQTLFYETELGVVIGAGGRDIAEADAMKHVAGYVLALDMTAKCVQQRAMAKKHPWTIAKGFDTFCPVSAPLPVSAIPDTNDVSLWLKIDGKLVQSGHTRDLVFRVPRLIACVSAVMTLSPGDLILTGTPAGVGAVLPGQVLSAGMEAGGKLVATLQVTVVRRAASASQL